MYANQMQAGVQKQRDICKFGYELQDVKNRKCAHFTEL